MTRNRKALIVEDDDYKCSDIDSVLPENYHRTYAKSVSSAARSVELDEFDLVILDMALPTFEKKIGYSSGSSQPQGGIEIIRALVDVEYDPSVIIVSQYPGIEIDKEFYTLTEAAEALRKRYNVKIVGAISYDFELSAWGEFFQDLVRDL